MYKNGTRVMYGGYDKISVAENIAAVLQLQDRFHAEVFSYEIDAESHSKPYSQIQIVV
jgi:hypothetical protein